MSTFNEIKFIYYPNKDETGHYTLELNNIENEDKEGFVQLYLGTEDLNYVRDIRLSYNIDKEEAQMIILYLQQQFNL